MSLVDSPGAPPITYADVDPCTTIPGFTQADVTVDATHVHMITSRLSVRAGQQFVIDLLPVPKPSLFVRLLGVGTATSVFTRLGRIDALRVTGG